MALGQPVRQVLFVALLVSLSSTAIVPMILFTHIFAMAGGDFGPPLVPLLGKGIGVVALVVVSARLLVPWLLFHVAGTRSREVFLMGDRLVVSGSPKDAVNVVDLARGVEG